MESDMFFLITIRVCSECYRNTQEREVRKLVRGNCMRKWVDSTRPVEVNFLFQQEKWNILTDPLTENNQKCLIGYFKNLVFFHMCQWAGAKLSLKARWKQELRSAEQEASFCPKYILQTGWTWASFFHRNSVQEMKDFPVLSPQLWRVQRVNHED